MEIEDGDTPKPKLTEKGIHDYHLIRAALDNNDQKAYAELLQRYQESIYFMIHKIVGNDIDAEDLTIEAIGKAFNRLHKYSPEYSFSTWMFRIATNHAIDFIRNNKLKNDSMVDVHSPDDENGFAAFEHFHSTYHTPEEDMVRKEKIQVLREIVDKLHPRYKVLIEAYYFEELSVEEISVKLNIPQGTVKGQMSRAREFMAFLLNEENGKI